MNNIVFPNDFEKSTLKRYATNIPLLIKFIDNYTKNNPDSELIFKINNESRKPNEISFYFQMEHTLVLNGGRDMKGAKPGIVKSIYNDKENYNVRVDNHNSFLKFNIVVEYSNPNIYNITNSNTINETSKNKIIYIPPIPFNLETSFCKKNIDILTSYICVGNSKRREVFMNQLKTNNQLQQFSKRNITNIFKLDDLQKLYKDTKIIVNVHQTDHHHTFEEFRILPALLSGVLIVSEDVPCKEQIPYSDYIIWTKLDNIYNTIYEVLDSYEVYFNNIFRTQSGLKNIIDNMLDKSEKDFINKITEYIPKKKESTHNKMSINQNINIEWKDMNNNNNLFDFDKFSKCTKEIEAEFKRLSTFEQKYNDLYDESKDLRKQLKLLKNDKIPQSQHFSLNKCALDYGLDKVMRFKDGKHIFGHNFISSYNKIFKNFDIDDVDHVLEIGIGCLEKGQMGGKNGVITKFGYKTGNSLRMWRDCFINANIYGIDIYKEAMIINEDRIHTYVCDQSYPSQLKELMDIKIKKKLNVIVDDGSHELTHQIISFNTLSPYLKEGGIYIIECIQPKNISHLSNLSAFNNKADIEKKFNITIYDTRKDTNKNDDFMMLFQMK
jgi:hypothetical protein